MNRLHRTSKAEGNAWPRCLLLILFILSGSDLPADQKAKSQMDRDQGSAQSRHASLASRLGAEVMGGSLVGAAKASAEDFQNFDAAVSAFSARKQRDDFSALERYVENNPSAPWRIQLLNCLAGHYYRCGYFRKALAAWEKAWEEGKEMTDPDVAFMAGAAFGNLVRMHSRLGNLKRLEALQAELGSRELRGPADSKRRAALNAIGLMKQRPDIAFRCGPSALGRVLAIKAGKNGIDPRTASFLSTSKGTSLEQIYAESVKNGGGFQLARREPGAEVLVPAVVHWKAGHFAALTAKSGSTYIIRDTTFRDDFAMTREALDEEASGYFLVAAGSLPKGWHAVSTQEAANVWGKGGVDDGDDEDAGPPCRPPGDGPNSPPDPPPLEQGGEKKTCPKKDKPGDEPDEPDEPGEPGDDTPCRGMPVYTFHAVLGTLRIKDTPIWYKPGFGPRMDFRLVYNERDAYQPDDSPDLPYANFGWNWTHDYVGFVSYDISDKHWPNSVTVYERGGGIKVFTFPEWTPPPPPEVPPDPPVGVYIPDFEPATSFRNPKDGSYIRYTPLSADGSTSLATFERVFPNGASISYTKTQSSLGMLGRTYLTHDRSRRGAELQIVLTGTNPILMEKIIDAAGKETRFTYGNASYPSRIMMISTGTGATERHASFAYDGSGRLTGITDMGGLASQFEYRGNGTRITAITTPYGRTSFESGEIISPSLIRWVEATDPTGARERLEFHSQKDGIGAEEGDFPEVDGVDFDVTNLQYRNSFYWNKKAMVDHPGDYSKAIITHWLHTPSIGPASAVGASYKQPLENRVFYAYPEQGNTQEIGAHPWPTVIARIVRNESGTNVTQAYRYAYDNVGNLTQRIDPVGRTTKFGYDFNKQNLTRVIQVNDGTDEVLWEATSFAGPGMPTTILNTARQITRLTWHPTFKKITSGTNAKAEVITYTYETNSSDPSYGKLKTITGDVANVPITKTYDTYGRLASITDGDGYILSYQYDGLDRLTRTTYPDGTYEQTIYNRLDPEWTRDRLGRWTHYFYDSARRVAAVVDPASRVTKYDWCSCGALHGLIDANGNETKFKQDIQFRTIEKEYADGKKILFEYEPEISRLMKKTDAKAQVTNYKYFVDNKPHRVSYTDEEGEQLSPPTPGVSFEYDPYYNRVTTMMDGSGTTSYTYYAWSSTGQLGAAGLQIVDGPTDSGSSDAITYAYDQLGRLASRSISDSTESYTYDAKGRTTQIVNALGTFGYTYDGTSERLTGVTYPSVTKLNTSFTYLSNTGNHRLGRITHSLDGSEILAQFNYAYDAAGNITQWKQQIGVGAVMSRWELKYDAVDQLISGNKRDGNTVLEQNVNRYDNLGNRLTKQVNSVVTTGTFNNLNQLVALSGGGRMAFEGMVSEPATVTVGGDPASVDSGNTYRGEANVTTGTNNIPIIARDASNNSRTNTARVVVPFGTGRSLTYDDNGNLTADGERNYEWDAQDRMIVITYVGNSKRSEFTYDGQNRCVRIVEKNSGTTTSDKCYLWDRLTRAEERGSNGVTVLKQYFTQGFKTGMTKYYYAKDHLGSIWGLVDDTGTMRGQWTYDLWGRKGENQVASGAVGSDFSFTGHFQHEESGLVLAPFRSYDPVTARWLSRDPIGEMAGINLYGYVSNNPVRRIDPFGLDQGEPGSPSYCGIKCDELCKISPCPSECWKNCFDNCVNGKPSPMAPLSPPPIGPLPVPTPKNVWEALGEAIAEGYEWLTEQ